MRGPHVVVPQIDTYCPKQTPVSLWVPVCSYWLASTSEASPRACPRRLSLSRKRAQRQQRRRILNREQKCHVRREKRVSESRPLAHKRLRGGWGYVPILAVTRGLSTKSGSSLGDGSEFQSRKIWSFWCWWGGFCALAVGRGRFEVQVGRRPETHSPWAKRANS